MALRMLTDALLLFGSSVGLHMERRVKKLKIFSPPILYLHVQAMALRMLTDAVLLFGSSVGLLMKRDVELWLKEQGVLILHKYVLVA